MERSIGEEYFKQSQRLYDLDYDYYTKISPNFKHLESMFNYLYSKEINEENMKTMLKCFYRDRMGIIRYRKIKEALANNTDSIAKKLVEKGKMENVVDFSTFVFKELLQIALDENDTSFGLDVCFVYLEIFDKFQNSDSEFFYDKIVSYADKNLVGNLFKVFILYMLSNYSVKDSTLYLLIYIMKEINSSIDFIQMAVRDTHPAYKLCDEILKSYDFETLANNNYIIRCMLRKLLKEEKIEDPYLLHVTNLEELDKYVKDFLALARLI